ncbi:MAG: hypothetical protein JST38_16945 [Bacteroidetes bacterium]|nr:hypothetical protein [Bacteroidota bacterium]MBS1942559.1 hypothetical protein [Bacteroidota bacterium]
MPRRSLLFPIIALVFACTTPQKHPSSLAATTPDSLQTTVDTLAQLAQAAGFRIVAQDPATLVFHNGDTLATGLKEFRLTGRLTDPLGRTWLLCRGTKERPLNGGTSLYILSSGDSAVHAALGAPWHTPGRLVDAATGKSYYEAETFAGEVLKDTVGVIWYERALMPNGQWKLNTTLLDLNGTHPDTLVFFGHGRKSTTLGLAFSGKCHILDSLDQRLK